MTVTCSVVPFADVPGCCSLCGTELTGRQRTWCSRKCSNAYRTQHNWTMARAAAKRRDKYRCVKCGRGREDLAVHLEVNHITPRLGGGYGWGCWHHLDNLETLCRSCHNDVTKAQRASRVQVAR